MPTTITPTQERAQIALRRFLLDVLGDVEVVAGGVNRVPEPRVGSFVVMTPLRITRLRTNIDSMADVRFTGSIAGTVLTVTDVAFGVIALESTIFGVGVDPARITEQVSGNTGGVGVYTVSASQTVSSRTLAAGQRELEQGMEIVFQCDFHSADLSAADMAQQVSTVLRDPAGVEMFAGQDPNYGIVPLYADDPVRRPFINESQQFEWFWSLDVHMQANQVVAVPQQFADDVAVTLINTDAAYPP